MPTYEYECDVCCTHFERFQQMSEEPLKECPKCGGSVKRLIGRGSGIIFKGSGFYATDYAKDSRKDKAESGKDTPCSECEKPCEEKPADE